MLFYGPPKKINTGKWFDFILLKLKRMKPGGSILLLKLTKLTNLTKPKLMKKMYNKGKLSVSCIQTIFS